MEIFLLGILSVIPTVYAHNSVARFNPSFIIWLSCLIILIFSLGYSQEIKIQRAKPMMGTMVEITVFKDTFSHQETMSDRKAEEAIELAFQAISRVDKLMSNYKPDSQLSLINQRAGRDYVSVDKEVMEVIKMAIETAELSGGAFDITVAPLVQLWGFHRKNGHLPPVNKVNNLLSLVNYENILIDEEHSQVKLKLPGMVIDLGGIAKGYAVDKAIDALKNSGIQRALVNAGGDLFTLGHPPGRNFWHIGIRHPLVPDRIVSTLRIRDQAVATSGNYENFFVLNGRRYSHILDPRTGQPIQGIASVTILAKTAMEADVLATTVAVLGPQKGMELLDSRPETEGIIILDAQNRPSYLLSRGLEGKLSFNF